MVRIAYVADVHCGNHRRHGGPMSLGLNRRCFHVLETLKAARDVAIAERCELMIVAGDLFDTNRPTPQMIAVVQEIMASNDLGWVVIKGNHDSAGSEAGDHALGPLHPVATVIDQPQIVENGNVDLLCVPFREGRGIEWFPKAVKQLAKESRKGSLRLLVFHLGIEDEHTSKFLQGARDSVPLDLVEDVMDVYGITYAFAGNWHDHRHWYIRDGVSGIVQCGTLCPTGWDNSGTEDHGFVIIYDTKPPEGRGFAHPIEVPGPRFLDVDGPKASGFLKALKEQGHRLYVRYRCETEEMHTATQAIREWTESGLIVAGEVVPDEVEQEAAARTAAMAARSSTTLEKALAAYIGSMPIEPVMLAGGEWEPDRGEILARSKYYLQEGSKR